VVSLNQRVVGYGTAVGTVHGPSDGQFIYVAAKTK
jgi:hypothetical protein